jgi:hypothetical protein
MLGENDFLFRFDPVAGVGLDMYYTTASAEFFSPNSYGQYCVFQLQPDCCSGSRASFRRPNGT